jgi:hypothetical protein
MPITPVINGYVYDLASTPDNNSLNEILNNMAGLNSLTESIQTLSATPPSPSQPTYGWYNTYIESGKYWNFYQNLLTLQGTAGGTYDAAIASVTNEFGAEEIPLGGGGTNTFEDIYLALFPSGIQSDTTNEILQNSYFNDRLNLVSAVIYMRANLADKIQQAYASLENYYDSTVVMRPSLQNYLLYEYAFASEGILNSEMNILGNTVQANNSALVALNKLGDVMNANVDLKMDLYIQNNSQIDTSAYKSAVQSGVNELQDCMGFIASFSSAPTSVADNGKIKLTFKNVTNADTLFVKDQNVVLSTTTSFPNYAFVVNSVSGTTLTLISINDLTTVPLADTTKSYFGFYDYDTITQFSSDVSNSFYTVISNSEMYDYISTGSSTWFNDLTAHSNVEAATTNVLYFNDTQKQKLNEAFYIYSKFYQSAASIMTGLDQTISASAQRVKGR